MLKEIDCVRAGDSSIPTQSRENRENERGHRHKRKEQAKEQAERERGYQNKSLLPGQQARDLVRRSSQSAQNGKACQACTQTQDGQYQIRQESEQESSTHSEAQDTDQDQSQRIGCIQFSQASPVHERAYRHN